MSNTVLVTRHAELIDAAKRAGLADDSTPVLTHVTSIDEIRDKRVIGILPAHLAVYARSITIISGITEPALNGPTHCIIKTVSVRRESDPDSYDVAFLTPEARSLCLRAGFIDESLPWYPSYVIKPEYRKASVFGYVPWLRADAFGTITTPVMEKTLAQRTQRYVGHLAHERISFTAVKENEWHTTLS